MHSSEGMVLLQLLTRKIRLSGTVWFEKNQECTSTSICLDLIVTKPVIIFAGSIEIVGQS